MSGRQFLTPAVAHAELDTLLSLFSGMLEGYPGDGREFMTIAETEAIARLCSRAFLRLAKDCGADRALVEADMKEWNEVILEEVGKMQAEREAESPR